MKKYFSMLPVLFYAVTPQAATQMANPIKTDISAGYTYDDNVSRAELARDIEKDSIFNVDASATYKLVFDKKSFFLFEGDLAVNQYLDFEKLSNTRLGVSGSYNLRLSPGYTASRYFAKVGYEQRLYKSDQRDGSAVEIELGLNKRLTDVMAMRLGFIIESISADEKTFDADNNRLYVDLDFKLTSKNNAYITLFYVDGDVVSTAVPTAKIINASSSIVRDDAFLDETPSRFAYKLGAKTISLRVGDSYSLSSTQGIDGSFLYYDSSADGDNDYTGLIFNLNYLHRF